jgi:pyrroline-5-carboxylate reductase
MKISFIGGGNAASAIINGITGGKILPTENICVSDLDGKQLETFKKRGIVTTSNNQHAVDFGDYIFLTIKPQQHDEVLANLKNTANKVFITVAPGVTTEYISKKLNNARVIRTMPNTPAMIGEGVTAVARGKGVTQQQFDAVQRLLFSFSTVYEFNEDQMNGIVALSGSSPAYVYMLIEAMTNYSAKNGIDYATAVKIAAQSVLGAAQMVLVGNETPSRLRQQVCTEGGTTIKAVEKMEHAGFLNIINDAMDACTKRAKQLENNV